MGKDRQAWLKANFPNLWFRDYKTDRYYMYRQKPYKPDYLGIMTEEQAVQISAKLKENRKLKAGFQSWAEMQMAMDEEKQKATIQEEQERKEVIARALEANNTIGKYYENVYWPERQKRKGSHNQNRTVDGHFRNWLKPHVGHISFSDFSYKDIDRIIQAMRDKGKNETTIKHTIDTLANIWNRATEDGLVSKPFPRKKAEKLQVDNEKTCFLTRDEADLLLETLKTWKPQTSLVHEKTLYGFCVLSLFTGLRCSEIESLTWQNVAAGRVVKTKNGKARAVHFDVPEIKKMLDKRRDMFPDHTPHDHLFPDQPGNVAISKEFSRVVELLGFNQVPHRIDDPRERINFHALRHTFASWLAMESVPLFEIMVLLGHSSLKMVQRYAALSPSYTRAAVMKISKMKEADFLAQENKTFIEKNEESVIMQ